MDIQDVNKKDLKNMLWKSKVDQLEYLTEEERQGVFQLGRGYYEDVKHQVSYQRDGDVHILTWETYQFEFKKLQLNELISNMIDLFEDILPLGSVVDLKKQYLKGGIPKETVGYVRMIITQRFAFQKDATTYFQYGGVVYPIGCFERDKFMYFTTAFIEKVIWNGYTDYQEDAFVYSIKQELVIARGMHSVGFASTKEFEKLQSKE